MRSSSMPPGASFVAAEQDQPPSATVAGSAELARLYDLDLAGQLDDVEFYLALAGRRVQTILELGCGSGRLAVPLAAAGHTVVGVDNDAHMLRRAEAAWRERQRQGGAERGGGLTLIEGDLAALDLERRFELAILGLNMLPALPGRAAQRAALAAAARHLQPPTGRLVIDVSLPTPAELTAWDGSLSVAWQRTDPDSGDEVAKLWSADFDHVRGVAVVNTYFDIWPRAGGGLRRIHRRDELWLLGVGELEGLAHEAGLRVEQAGGDYAMSPLGPASERALLVCALL
jgi:SAM-dependent methyltransferase